MLEIHMLHRSGASSFGVDHSIFVQKYIEWILRKCDDIRESLVVCMLNTDCTSLWFWAIFLYSRQSIIETRSTHIWAKKQIKNNPANHHFVFSSSVWLCRVMDFSVSTTKLKIERVKKRKKLKRLIHSCLTNYVCADWSMNMNQAETGPHTAQSSGIAYVIDR